MAKLGSHTEELLFKDENDSSGKSKGLVSTASRLVRKLTIGSKY